MLQLVILWQYTLQDSRRDKLIQSLTLSVSDTASKESDIFSPRKTWASTQAAAIYVILNLISVSLAKKIISTT